MCGIVGHMHIDGGFEDHSLIYSMATALQHRGPDEDGFFSGTHRFRYASSTSC